VSFSEDVRNELAAIAPERECDRRAELSALFHSAGRLHLRGHGEVSLHLDLASSAVARRAFSLLRSFGVEQREGHQLRRSKTPRISAVSRGSAVRATAMQPA
jgi:DNA-binding transcriptional regulator WhiA